MSLIGLAFVHSLAVTTAPTATVASHTYWASEEVAATNAEIAASHKDEADAKLENCKKAVDSVRDCIENAPNGPFELICPPKKRHKMRDAGQDSSAR